MIIYSNTGLGNCRVPCILEVLSQTLEHCSANKVYSWDFTHGWSGDELIDDIYE